VGGTQLLSADVRVIAASNKDLMQLVREGTFREDLFYRLNVIRIEIPALRQRREDIPLLVEHFLQKHASVKRKVPRLSSEAMTLLMGYSWPGNVRELENEIMRATALGGEIINREDLSPHISGAMPLALNDPDDLDLRKRIEHLERDFIQRALNRTQGNHTHAARLLGLSRYGLLKKLQRFAQGVSGKSSGKSKGKF
jgi:two-component system response regulator AtoC